MLLKLASERIRPPLIPAMLCLVVLLTGCRSLQPIELPDEVALPPAQSELWTEVSAIRPGDWVAPLNTGQEALEWRLRMIESATQSIDLQTFLWFDDEAGLRIIRHLYAAADRGVRIRLLLDDTFTAGHAEEIWQIDHHPNIEFRIFNPYDERFDSMAIRTLLNLGEFRRVDHRMHNKVLIVDNRAAIVGGRNHADAYFGYDHRANFRDLEVICVGAVTRDLSAVFDRFWNDNWTFPEELLTRRELHGEIDWKADLPESVVPWEEDTQGRWQEWRGLAANGYSGEIEVSADAPPEVRPGSSEDIGRDEVARDLYHMIDLAREEVILVTAYLVPTPELEEAVREAEERGVEVRILTNSMMSNNHLAAHSAYNKHTRQLVHHGADLHEVRAMAKDRSFYMRTPVDDKHLGLHGKFALIDQQYTIVGSANLDPRSLRLNTELNVIIESEELNAHLRRDLELDFDLRNAWHLQAQPDGSIHWVSDDAVLKEQPAVSPLQRLENWFLRALPIEGEM